MAQSGNGVDIGTIYQLLTRMSARMDDMSARMDTLSARLDQVLSLVAEHSRILADHSRQLDDLSASVASLRGDVGHYHEAVISQGIHYSDVEGRVLRVERHLKLKSGN